MDANLTDALLQTGGGAVGVGGVAWYLFKKVLSDLGDKHHELKQDTERQMQDLSTECKECRAKMEARLKSGDDRFHSQEIQMLNRLSEIKEILVRTEAKQDLAKDIAKELAEIKHGGN